MKMTKWIQCVFCLLLSLLLTAGAFAENTWYTLSEDGKTLSLCLPCYDDETEQWAFELDENALCCIAQTRQEGAWNAVFAAADGHPGTTTLFLHWLHSDGSTKDVYAMQIYVDDAGRMCVPGVERLWYSLSEDGTVLTVTLASSPSSGYRWFFEPYENKGLELIGEDLVFSPEDEDREGASGMWYASFRAADGFTGETGVRFFYKRTWEPEEIKYRQLELVVTADGRMMNVVGR